MSRIFATDRRGSYNLLMSREDNRLLVVSIDVGTNGLAVVLTGPEEKALREALLLVSPADLPQEPIPMLLTCPGCSERHIDEGDFATKPHHTHACQHCGMVWRPAKLDTVGVRFLPGYKNGEHA